MIIAELPLVVQTLELADIVGHMVCEGAVLNINPAEPLYRVQKIPDVLKEPKVVVPVLLAIVLLKDW